MCLTWALSVEELTFAMPGSCYLMAYWHFVF